MKKTFNMKRTSSVAAAKPKKSPTKPVTEESDDIDNLDLEDDEPVVKKPVGKKPPAKKQVKEDIEDDIDDITDEDEDDGYEPPKKQTKKPAATGRKPSRPVDEDEEDLDDADEDPRAKKRRAVDSDGVQSEKRGRRKKFALNDVPGFAENKDWTDKLQILTRDEIIKATSSRNKGVLVRLFAPTDRGEESTIVSFVWPNFEKSDGKVSGRKFTFHPDDCNDACYPEDDNELYQLCKEYGYNPVQEMFIPVIVRDKQDEIGDIPTPSKKEAKTGYQDLDDPTPSPIYMLRISKKVFNDKIKSQVVQVKTSGKRGSSSESYPIWDPVHGKDILLTCTYDKSKPPIDRYEFSVSPQEKTPLTEEEDGYLIPDVMGALDEALSEEDRMYIPSQFLKENIIHNKFGKDDKKKGKTNNRRKDDDDEDMYENTSSRKRVAKKPKDDDEDDDDSSFDEGDEEDDGYEPPKRQAKKPAATRRKPSRPVDEDEEDDDDDDDDDLPF